MVHFPERSRRYYTPSKGRMSSMRLYVHPGGFSSAFAEILLQEVGFTYSRLEVELHTWQQFTYVLLICAVVFSVVVPRLSVPASDFTKFSALDTVGRVPVRG
jgi:hypothetical protein